MNESEVRKYVLEMEEAGMDDVARVGGKNASLGEMIQKLSPKGVKVPSGFIVTAQAYRYFMSSAHLDEYIRNILKGLDTRNVVSLAKKGKEIRQAILKASFPSDLALLIKESYEALEKESGRNVDVAVRSSATAEDLPGASFAGEHETYLGVRGFKDVVEAVKAAMASLFTNRAISYRQDKGFDHMSVALSVAVQRMVRSDLGASGVMFTLDTESGFKDIVIINGSWGLGEMVVQGKVVPDEFMVAKALLGKAPNPIISKSLGGKALKMLYD